MVNKWLLIAALIATLAMLLHIFTFERWIWPNLGYECFPVTPFGAPKVARGYYRIVWHSFTVNLLVTIIVCILVGVGTLVPYGMLLIYFLLLFWILMLVEIFFIAAMVLEPGDSYIKSMLRSFQWVFVLLIIVFMYLGTKYQVY
jgi:hypothetical protein